LSKKGRDPFVNLDGNLVRELATEYQKDMIPVTFIGKTNSSTTKNLKLKKGRTFPNDSTNFLSSTTGAAARYVYAI